jgi:N-acyl-D-aspartate/D-glutamate deacylase
MGDVVIKGGTVVDGTGAAGFAADVRLSGGRIAEVGPDLAGGEVLDASGAVVAPGFIDTHTHLDPSMFWDPACDPMPQHGVTTALIGNCSLSLAPVRPEHLDDLIDVFSYIEDIPLADFRDGVPWAWKTWREYRDAIDERGAGLNVASLVGHSMLRMYAMGDDAWTRPATADEVAAMCAELADAMDGGCYGLSTSAFDVDRKGRPVPSRVADDAELRALAEVLGAAGHGVVEFIPNLTGGDVHAELRHLAGILGPLGVTTVWNGLLHNEHDPARSEGFMALSEELGIWPVASPRTVDFNVNWEQTMLFMMLPEGWNRVMQVAGEERRALLLDEAWRADARAEWDREPKSMFPITRIDRVRFTSVTKPELEPWLGRSLADLVAERGGHPSDVFADWVLENDLVPGVVAVGVSNGDVDGVAGLMADPRALVSASDAGAHVQMMCAAGDTTLLLTRHVRDRSDLTLEHAVHELTGRQADVFGFHDRGRIRPGLAADLVVFSLDELDWGHDVFVTDLPSGAARLRRPAGGYRATFVSGVATQVGGELTGAAPGRVLRSRRAS